MSQEREFEKVQILRNNGKLSEAVVEYELIRMVALMKNQPELAANCQHMVGVSYYQFGSWNAARVHLMRALRAMRVMENKLGEGAVLRDLGMNEAKRENWEEARRFLAESLRVLADYPGHRGMTRVKLGVLEKTSRSSMMAVGLIRRGMKEITGTQERFFESTGYWELAQLEAGMNNPKSAIEAYEKSMEILMDLGGEEKFLARMNEMRKWRQKLTGG